VSRTVKDTALDALKRSAKAILRVELSALRKRARLAEESHRTCVDNAHKANQRMAELQRQVDALHAEHRAMRTWFNVNGSPGELSLRCWVEHLNRDRVQSRVQGYELTSFARWGLPNP